MKTMNMMMIGTALLAVAVSSTASAGWLQDTAKRAERSVRTEIGRGTGAVHNVTRRTVSYKVKIRNQTGRGIHYRLNGVPQLLSNDKIRTHTGSDVSGPGISFDNGNNQTIKYALGRNSTYVFQWKRGVLDLYND